MNLSNSEKLILAMLCDIHEKLGIDKDGDHINHELVSEAISSDNTWALNWEYENLLALTREEKPQVLTDVCDILDMWDFIEDTFARLSDADKKIYMENVPGYCHDPKFSGFDGNNESEYLSTASFLVEKLNRYDSFKGRIVNSHTRNVDKYLSMYKVFKPIRENLIMENIKVDDLIKIMNA